MKRIACLAVAALILSAPASAQDAPPAADARIYEIIEAASPERIEADITRLVSFGTRNTLSDTTSATRGIASSSALSVSWVTETPS